MNQFQLYFQLGIQHILDLEGFDHILFVVVLCALYMPRDWKRIIILVTAFTLGHSLTLALATLNLIRVNEELIEFLIPVTIAITALTNVFKPRPKVGSGLQLNYLYAGIFGLIHGLGFSNYLRSLLGQEASILQPLFAFNVGLEVGQLVIVAFFLVFTSIFVGIFSMPRRDWTLVTSAVVLGMAIMMLLDARYW
ncbi:hypothetical protein A3SI_17554 [Nitritalea halalkaliphila LW7]|uniref:HupE / UreJ protein n=1 Tax=Nitritalea halalkaliphila LW7 TaxID=1189621 RepID=I5BVX0_9BACT|nr:HupE/UreJ family protein [Nitritalea halalkaliphila]EIM73722.1 hypothetical protein A3SI_17554 [Nitritalea halalkaliphila LW7]